MNNESVKYESVSNHVESLGSVVPKQLAKETKKALSKLHQALGGDVSGYVAHRLHMNLKELNTALASEQVDGVALAMYNIEKRAQSVIIGDQTGIGKGRQAAAMIRYGLLSGYLPIFFTDRYTLFSDMFRDCKALGIKDARPLVVNSGACVVDFDNIIEHSEIETPDEIWTPTENEEGNLQQEHEIMQIYQEQYEVVYKAPKKKILQKIFASGDIPTETYDYLMITYSQLKNAKQDITRLDFLQSLCEKHRVLFIFDEAHKSSSVSAGKVSVITQCINSILTKNRQIQCVFLSATFAKRPESLITYMRRTALSALATENTLEKALHNGGIPMQEYVASTLAAEGQMIRREHSSDGIPEPIYTYLDDERVIHGELFDKVMYFFREIVKLSAMVHDLVSNAQLLGFLFNYKCYPTRSQLFYINKILLLALKAQKVAEVAVNEVKHGRSVVIGMSDTLECVLKDVVVTEEGTLRGDISTLLIRLLDKTVCNTCDNYDTRKTIFEILNDIEDAEVAILKPLAEEIKDYYNNLSYYIKEEVFHLPMSPIDVIRQIITREKFIAPDGLFLNIRFEECTGRAHQVEYLSPDGDDDFINARLTTRKKRHSNHIFNDFQNNKLDVILINACGAIGASAHAIATTEVPDEQVRQRKMLIVQNDLDVNIDLQKRGRINRTGQRIDLPPLYEYIITAIPSEKRLNMMLRAKLRSLSANTAAYQDQDKNQADFIDICNKYGNEVAVVYLNEHQELATILDIRGKVTANKLLAKIAMLSVTAQQDIVDDLIAAYTTFEAELRRVNQWDLEREYRDFEAALVREELFTTAKSDSRLGSCSYLSVYKCRQKTFPYTYEDLEILCKEAAEKFGPSYSDNPTLQKQLKDYYNKHNREIRARFKERRILLHDSAKRILVGYCKNEALSENLLERACKPVDSWPTTLFDDLKEHKKVKQIMRKLVSFSNEYNVLINREDILIKKYASEKKRLIEILSKTTIGAAYYDVSEQLASDETPNRVIAVLRDIRFGKEDSNRFLPSRVEFVFALTAVFTELRINMVHNNKWSNYKLLREIVDSKPWKKNISVWNSEIASNNNKIVERKIITGNILGAYVHPSIAELKPRFITFSLKKKHNDKVQTQIGLLLPLDESKIRNAIKSVSIPLHEGIKYANNTNSSYLIAGLKVNFSLLPFIDDTSEMKFIISVMDNHSKLFEEEKAFDDIKIHFTASRVISIYDKEKKGKDKSKILMHYQTELLTFKSEPFQSIIQTLAQMDAVIIVPREQITYGDVKTWISQSQKDEDTPWDSLNWKNTNEIIIPPIKEKLLLRISAPTTQKEQNGKAVFRHSERYILAQDTIALEGLSLSMRSSLDSFRRCFMKWKKYYTNYIQLKDQWQELELPTLIDQRNIMHELQTIIESASKNSNATFNPNIREVLQKILKSEHLNTYGIFVKRFEEEMLFLSPDKQIAQAFIDAMPCSSQFDDIRKCVLDYIEGKTDIINSHDRW